ncbi:unnamed protein product, partial [Ascophyllum nodosum]
LFRTAVITRGPILELLSGDVIQRVGRVDKPYPVDAQVCYHTSEGRARARFW